VVVCVWWVGGWGGGGLDVGRLVAVCISRVILNSAGSISKATAGKIEPQAGDAALEACVSRRTSRWGLFASLLTLSERPEVELEARVAVSRRRELGP